MSNASEQCASNANPHRRDIDMRSPDDTPERGITFGRSLMLGTSGYTRATPVELMRNPCSTLARPSMDKIGSDRRVDLEVTAEQGKHATDASEQCARHRRIAYATYGRTDGLTNELLKLSNAVVGRLAHAHEANRRFAVPIVEIHSPETGLSTGLCGAA